MSHTVIGIFDNSTEAHNAVDKLSSNGFTIDQVDITYDNQHSVLETTNSEHASFGERVSRFFKSIFEDEEESSRYTNMARNAAIVTIVSDTNEQAIRAAEILDSCGAIDIDERLQQFTDDKYATQQDITSSTGTITTDKDDEESIGTRDRNYADDTNQSIPVIEEELQVGKREVERSGVRLRSRIVERPVEQIIRLREERIWVERNPVNRPAVEGDLDSFREGEIEITQRAEVPVVNKEARVVEEINVNKEVRNRDEVIRDTVRKTEVDIDEASLSDSKLNRGEKRNDI